MLQDEDIAAEESLREACERAGIGQEVTDNLIGQIATPAVKEELKKATEEALDLGVSGGVRGERWLVRCEGYVGDG